MMSLLLLRVSLVIDLLLTTFTLIKEQVIKRWKTPWIGEFSEVSIISHVSQTTGGVLNSSGTSWLIWEMINGNWQSLDRIPGNLMILIIKYKIFLVFLCSLFVFSLEQWINDNKANHGDEKILGCLSCRSIYSNSSIKALLFFFFLQQLDSF